ncbi:type II secretion system protein N [Variovorax ginsengisoli]|uniref:Type II secretion system protein N n=1 Tax=Variovorax ginsengisoli TaxID=363844 RepID=A0ABT9S8A4_9BURK|nr:type II secretion system protein N [Variovorax ginsengisoli]MDP9900582.1 general secretion pathway protein N [Variovorax ginsengisoli]
MATSAPLRPLHAAATAGWRWAVAGALLGTLLTLALFAPARWLASALVHWTDGHLRLVNARGTVWNGTAGLVFASGVGGAEAISLPGQFHWRLRPRWDGVSAALDLPCCAPAPLQLLAHPRSNGVQLVLADGRSRWPAAMLTGFGAPFNTLKTEGVLDLITQSFAVEVQGRQLALQGRATLDASDISSSLSTLRPMGSYRLALQGGSTPSLLLTTREGSLQLNGSGYWTGTAMRFNGEASAAPGSEDALSNLLNIIGRRNGARSLITLG